MEQLLIRQIPNLQSNARITPINKGYSSDQKYIVEQDDRKFLLKTFERKEYSSKEMEFEALRRMEQMNVRCSRPLGLGQFNNDEQGYMLLSYVEGEDASEVLAHLSDQEQYQIGYNAGVELQKIHGYIAPEGIASWNERKLKKHHEYLTKYKQLGIRIKKDTAVLAFIENHLHLMEHRPNLFQHDDYHVGNLIIKGHNLSGIIDFGRFDWGDPIHEFLKVGMFSAEVSIPFSMGQIRGYHQGTEPDDLFWKLYSLYLAMCLISSVVWIVRVKPEETAIMMGKIEKVLDDHDYFKLMKPKWYSEKYNGL